MTLSWFNPFNPLGNDGVAKLAEALHTENLLKRGFEDVPLENSDVVLLAHNRLNCWGPSCSLHRRSEHHMRGWQQHWRSDRGIMERICPDKGIGHPDPDDYKCRMDETGGEGIHGCDGCCAGPFDTEMRERWKTYSEEMRKQEAEMRELDRENELAWWED